MNILKFCMLAALAALISVAVAAETATEAAPAAPAEAATEAAPEAAAEAAPEWATAVMAGDAEVSAAGWPIIAAGDENPRAVKANGNPVKVIENEHGDLFVVAITAEGEVYPLMAGEAPVFAALDGDDDDPHLDISAGDMPLMADDCAVVGLALGEDHSGEVHGEDIISHVKAMCPAPAPASQ